MSTSPRISHPRDTARAWAEAFAERDLDAMMELFAPESIWVSPEGAAVEGLEGIRRVFADFLSLEDAVYEAEDPTVYQAGEVALLSASWTVEGRSADGDPVVMSGRTADVMRQVDGRWRYVIDSPFGGGQPTPTGA
jgi:ketosteroid isomerase-like protein